MFENLWSYYNRLTEAIFTTLKIKKKITKIEKKLKDKLKNCNPPGEFEDQIGLHLSEEEYKDVDKEAIKDDE